MKINHEEVQRAYDNLRFDEIIGLEMTETCDGEAEQIRHFANEKLNIYGLKVDKEWRQKVNTRYLNMEDKVLTFSERHQCVFVNGKYESGKEEIEGLPF